MVWKMADIPASAVLSAIEDERSVVKTQRENAHKSTTGASVC